MVSRDGETLQSAAADPIHVSQTNFAFNAGAGVIHALNDRVGLRADLRYFLAFVDETNRNGAYAKDYRFVRATFGVTLRLHGN